MASIEVHVEKSNQTSKVATENSITDTQKAEKTATKEVAAGNTAGATEESKALARATAVERSKKLADELARAAKAAKEAAEKAAEDLEVVVQNSIVDDKNATTAIFQNSSRAQLQQQFIKKLQASSAFSGQSPEFIEKLAAAAASAAEHPSPALFPASAGKSSATNKAVAASDASTVGQHKEVVIEAQAADTATNEIVHDSSAPATRDLAAPLEHQTQKEPNMKRITEVSQEQGSNNKATAVDASAQTMASVLEDFAADEKAKAYREVEAKAEVELKAEATVAEAKAEATVAEAAKAEADKAEVAKAKAEAAKAKAEAAKAEVAKAEAAVAEAAKAEEAKAEEAKAKREADAKAKALQEAKAKQEAEAKQAVALKAKQVAEAKTEAAKAQAAKVEAAKAEEAKAKALQDAKVEAKREAYAKALQEERVEAEKAQSETRTKKFEEIAHEQAAANKAAKVDAITQTEASQHPGVASAMKLAEVVPEKLAGGQEAIEKGATSKVAEKIILTAGTAAAGQALEAMASVEQAIGKREAAEKLLADKIAIEKHAAELAAARKQALHDAQEARDSALESMGKWVVPTAKEKSRVLKAIEERHSMEQHRSNIDQAAWQARIEQEGGTKLAFETATAAAEVASKAAADKEAAEKVAGKKAAHAVDAGSENKEQESNKSATKPEGLLQAEANPGGLLQERLRAISAQNTLEAASTVKAEANMTRVATNLTRAAAEEAMASRVSSNLTSVASDALRMEANMTRVAAKATRVGANVTRMEAKATRVAANKTDAETETTSEAKSKAVTTVTLRGILEITLCTFTSFFVMFFFARRHKEKGETLDLEESIQSISEAVKSKPQLPSGSPFSGLGNDESLEELQKFIPGSEPADEFFDAVEAEGDEFAEAQHEASAPPKISSWRCQCSRRQQKPHAPVEQCCSHLTWEVEYH